MRRRRDAGQRAGVPVREAVRPSRGRGVLHGGADRVRPVFARPQAAGAADHDPVPDPRHAKGRHDILHRPDGHEAVHMAAHRIAGAPALDRDEHHRRQCALPSSCLPRPLQSARRVFSSIAARAESTARKAQSPSTNDLIWSRPSKRRCKAGMVLCRSVSAQRQPVRNGHFCSRTAPARPVKTAHPHTNHIPPQCWVVVKQESLPMFVHREGFVICVRVGRR